MCRRNSNGIAVHRRQSAFIIFSAVLFSALTATENTVLALVSKQIGSKTTIFPPTVSDRNIHIGNLDWQLPIGDVTKKITKVVCTNRSEDEDPSFDVKVAELPFPRRKRDEGKFHQGSATVTFASAKDASTAMEALLLASKSSGNDWKIRWAFAPSSTEQPKTQKEISPELLTHRKKRAEKYARKRRRTAEATDKVIKSLLAKLDLEDRDSLVHQTPVLQAPLLDWNTCPKEIDPMQGGKIRKGTQRGERKRAAVEAFLEVVRELLLAEDDSKTKRLVADLGCGAGNLTVPLAWWLKQLGFGVSGVDINAQALMLLSKRADRLGIDIHTLHADLLTLSKGDGGDEMWSDCIAVVSLHACGAASDLSMAAAVQNELPFAISPCCIGKLSTERTYAGRMPSSAQRSAAPDAVTYPRSSWLRDIVSQDDYKLLAAAADYGVGNSQVDDERERARRQRCKLSKKIIEMDRLQWAKEHGYCIRLLEMPRIGPLYPKRELLLGAKEGSSAAILLSRLPTE